MSHDKSLKKKNNNSLQLTDDCNNLYTNIRRENSINSYLKKTSRRGSYHFKQLQDVTDSYIYDGNVTEKQNADSGFATIRYQQTLEKKIEEVIESKFGKLIQLYVQKYVSKVLEDHKKGLQVFYRSHIEDIEEKMVKTQQGYTQMIKNYDQFMKVVNSIREKPKKTDRLIAKPMMEQIMSNINKDINEIKERMSELEKEQESIKKMSLRELNTSQTKIEPIILNYEDKWDFNRQQLRIVVDTFNQNFIRIDQKLKEIASFIS